MDWLAARRELNHLLWFPPLAATRTMMADAGWACRDHAYILGLALACLGEPCAMVQGRAMYVAGPRPQRPPVGVGLDATHDALHWWLHRARGGLVDLSPRLEGLHLHDEFHGVVDGRWQPEAPGAGKVKVVTHAEDLIPYEQAIARASHASNDVWAIYGPINITHAAIGRAHLDDPFQFANSPRVKLLQIQGHQPQVYLSAALHLRALMLGRGTSLANITTDAAWAYLARAHADPRSTIESALP